MALLVARFAHKCVNVRLSPTVCAFVWEPIALRDSTLRFERHATVVECRRGESGSLVENFIVFLSSAVPATDLHPSVAYLVLPLKLLI